MQFSDVHPCISHRPVPIAIPREPGGWERVTLHRTLDPSSALEAVLDSMSHLEEGARCTPISGASPDTPRRR